MGTGESRYAVMVHASGRESYEPVSKAVDRAGFSYAGRRGTQPVFMEEKTVYWWNGHDVVKRDEYGCILSVPMRRPGEVVS
jgi:hypothetical protein